MSREGAEKKGKKEERERERKSEKEREKERKRKRERDACTPWLFSYERHGKMEKMMKTKRLFRGHIFGGGGVAVVERRRGRAQPHPGAEAIFIK